MKTGKEWSDIQEKQIARQVGGHTQSNSGGTTFGGGDILTSTFLIEAKTTTKPRKSFTVQKEWITKAQEQAFEQGRSNSAVAIRYEPNGEDYYIISERLFKILIQTLEEEI